MNDFKHPLEGARKRELDRGDVVLDRLRDRFMNQSAKHSFLSEQGRKEEFYSVWFKNLVMSKAYIEAAKRLEELKRDSYFWER